MICACVAASMFLQTLQCYSNLVHRLDNYHNVNWTMDQCLCLCLSLSCNLCSGHCNANSMHNVTAQLTCIKMHCICNADPLQCICPCIFVLSFINMAYAADGSPGRWCCYNDDKPVKLLSWEEASQAQPSMLIFNRRCPRQHSLPHERELLIPASQPEAHPEQQSTFVTSVVPATKPATSSSSLPHTFHSPPSQIYESATSTLYSMSTPSCVHESGVCKVDHAVGSPCPGNSLSESPHGQAQQKAPAHVHHRLL